MLAVDRIHELENSEIFILKHLLKIALANLKIKPLQNLQGF